MTKIDRVREAAMAARAQKTSKKSVKPVAAEEAPVVEPAVEKDVKKPNHKSKK
jgi:hypothetical protein